jgi:N-acetylglucosaminyldiphosphoundecaprenol N-acetyl-beta-D-mannosaminyltransferase
MTPERERGRARPTRLVDLAASCFVGDLVSAGELLVVHASRGEGGYVCLCNVHVLTAALHDEELLRAVTGAAVRFPDGAPVAWLIRRLGSPQARRIGGPDLVPQVVDTGRKEALRHFLVGSTERDLATLADEFRTRFPGCEIVGALAPPFAARPPVAEAVEAIRSAQPHLVWVGLGAPKQELWSVRASAELPGVTFVGVGAAFDFLAGVKRRAPSWMHGAGLEWLYRLASEPRRLFSRYARSNTEFVWRAGFELSEGLWSDIRCRSQSRSGRDR